MAARAAEEIVLDDRDSDLQDDETGSFQSAVNSSGDGDKDISQNDSFHSNNLTTTPISTNTARRVKGSSGGEGGFMPEEDSSGRVTDDGEGSFDPQEETDESEDDSRDEVLVPATPDPSDRPCSAVSFWFISVKLDKGHILGASVHHRIGYCLGSGCNPLQQSRQLITSKNLF